MEGAALSVVRFTPQIDCFALSHPGRRRSNNEDAYLLDRKIGLYIVCDGMGGHAAGEVASSMAVESVHGLLDQFYKAQMPRVDTFEQRQQLRKKIAQAIFEAGQKIFQAGKTNPNQKGMGTTLTLCWLLGQKIFLGHVGDSRCYLIRNGRTHQLTEDHTFFNEVKRAQGLEAAQKALARMPNALSRALGAQPAVQVDTMELDLLPGDRYILCSDGLHGYLDDRKVDIQTLIQEHPFSEAPQHLIHFANQMGGKDNITVVSIQIEGQEETLNTKKIRMSLASLRHLQLFQQLDYKEHIQVFNMFKMQDFKPNEVILRQGDPGDALYVLAQGQVAVHRDGKPIARLESGHHFGEMSLIDNVPRSATVVAETPCLVLHLSRDEFGRLIYQKPNLGVKLMGNLLRTMSKIVREQSAIIAQFSHGQLGPMQAPHSPGSQPPVGEGHIWDDPGELDLPTEQPVIPATDEFRAPHGHVENMEALQAMSTKGALPFDETLELNPFKPVQTRNPDPFGETAEFKAFPQSKSNEDDLPVLKGTPVGRIETAPTMPLPAMDKPKGEK